MTHENNFVLRFQKMYSLWGLKCQEHSEIGVDTEKIGFLDNQSFKGFPNVFKERMLGPIHTKEQKLRGFDFRMVVKVNLTWREINSVAKERGRKSLIRNLVSSFPFFANPAQDDF